MRAWHERFRSALRVSVEARDVTTSFGTTHVLVAGPSEGAPVVVVHGALASSAHLMLELEALADKHRVYAVDVLGQSPMSADVRLPVNDDSAGRWLTETMDALGLRTSAVLGVSWGGFVAQRLAAVAPERIATLVLLVPAGVIEGPRWRGFVELGWPLTRYVMTGGKRGRAQLLAALLSTPDDPLWGPYIAEAFLAARLGGMRVPRLSRAGEFARLTAPVHVIAADRDVSFPGEALVARARQLFPTLATAEVLLDTRHSPPTTPAFRREFGAKVLGLLANA